MRRALIVPQPDHDHIGGIAHGPHPSDSAQSTDRRAGRLRGLYPARWRGSVSKGTATKAIVSIRVPCYDLSNWSIRSDSTKDADGDDTADGRSAILTGQVAPLGDHGRCRPPGAPDGRAPRAGQAGSDVPPASQS